MSIKKSSWLSLGFRLFLRIRGKPRDNRKLVSQLPSAKPAKSVNLQRFTYKRHYLKKIVNHKKFEMPTPAMQ